MNHSLSEVSKLVMSMTSVKAEFLLFKQEQTHSRASLMFSQRKIQSMKRLTNTSVVQRSIVRINSRVLTKESDPHEDSSLDSITAAEMSAHI